MDIPVVYEILKLRGINGKVYFSRFTPTSKIVVTKYAIVPTEKFFFVNGL